MFRALFLPICNLMPVLITSFLYNLNSYTVPVCNTWKLMKGRDMINASCKVISSNIPALSSDIKTVFYSDKRIEIPSLNILITRYISTSAVHKLKAIQTDGEHTTFNLDFEHGRYLTLMCSTIDFEYIEKSLRQLKMKPFKVQTKPTPMAIITAAACLFALFMWPRVTISINQPDKVYTATEKAKICKAYIGALFAKSPSIMHNYRTENDLVYVRYERKFDRTTWSYVCDLSNNTISWSGWQHDIKQWGRWRDEDETRYKYNHNKNVVTFPIPRQNYTVTVQL